ncbi:MAG: ribosome silencing factor [Candidatus Marinimicrobia bacterium]|nr:ribosome silencing factor [Candidatus Neomarinimicrobiota bacterium]|tara:strand:+ start:888 stop:1241 length:354 start_codon:yes stop_codon:yes gene_type:complete
MTKTKKSLDPKKIASLMIDKKALDVKIINLNKLTTLTDYFIICTSESEPQTRAIFNHIKDELNKNNIKPWKTEGYEHLQWVIMDYINFVIHIFNKETREYYNFERLWGDAEIIEIDK